ncbi:MerR HTH family regulatory protein [Paenibacillus sp. UNC496MF]|uniref:MerR family transcriptional regulator n=1 Tax=Paenibacillus sp. UNC496MF TaxID=1502753 RepID=UPI0008E49530|nr:MerR family transcriptional regulator [Paenibacillus sp. UNC496MF]SFJ63611.1 MerR HTH family regulatory protein [Paenibacillus sp. UNC496MF]
MSERTVTEGVFTVRQVASILGIHRDTMKYWEENNLIPKARRNPKNGYRIYNEAEIKEIARSRGLLAVEIEAALVKERLQI